MKRRHEIVRRAKQVRRRRQAARLTFILFAVGVFLVGLILLIRLDRWAINGVAVEGNRLIPESEVAEAVRQELKGNYWLLFPKGNVLWYPKSAIEEKLLARFSNLASVNLRLLNLDTVVVLVEERRGKFVWCPFEIEVLDIERGSQTCYFSDESGLIFSAAPSLIGNVFLKFVGPLSSTPIGSRPLSEVKFRKIVNFESELRLRPLTIVQIVVDENDDFEFRFQNPSREDKRTLRLLLNINQDLNDALVNLRSAFTAAELQEIFRADPLALDYIDLRFPPKVFYRIRH